MSWSNQVFNYCERGLDPSFWAEPLNALSNAAFLVAALAAGLRLAGAGRSPGAGHVGERWVLWGLTGLVAAIGIGSFLFHTFATRWALLADVGPITVFMLAYLAFALRVFLGLGWLAIAVGLAAFLAAGSLVSGLTCAASEAGAGAAEPCFNGSLGYLPALLSLWGIGLVAARRGQAAGRTLLLAGAVFLVSVVLRTLDRDLCGATHVLGHARGTHVFWHLLNAVTLHLLLSAGIARLSPRPVEPPRR